MDREDRPSAERDAEALEARGNPPRALQTASPGEHGEPPEWEDVHEAPTLPNNDLKTRSRQPLVLVAVADSSDRDAFAERLATIGFRVLVASQAEEAMRLALFTRPDLVVIDAATPRVHGLEIVQRLRLDGRTRRIPIIAVTAPDELRLAARLAGCDAFLESSTKAADLGRVARALTPAFDGTRTPL